jgi:ferrous iron transport protein B
MPTRAASVIHFHKSGPLIALIGNPNCGKTALFNLLTGGRQKVANYAGVTVERKEGMLTLASGKVVRVLDLPGAYSLNPRSPDERVTVDMLYGRTKGERQPDLVVCVVDATNLRRNLRLVLAVKRLGIPAVVALNMADIADRRGVKIDVDALSRELELPVVRTVGVRAGGDAELRRVLASIEIKPQHPGALFPVPEHVNTAGDHIAVQRILKGMGLDQAVPHTMSDRIDHVVLHPVWGILLLIVTLFLMFQAVFSWATVPMAFIKGATAAIASAVGAALPPGWFNSLMVDGVVAGLGGVIVFLPQILILFFFILVLEESGYLPRAAFMLDRVMGSVGLSGRSFIPLLSSFACAILGIMAARTIANPRDRLVTIMIAPMMTCSARLPVYALLIGAFVPARQIAGVFQLQGLVLLALYIAGILGAMGVAWVLKHFTSTGRMVRPLMMELPNYHWPTLRNVGLGLWQRMVIFMKRVGGIILGLTILLWFLANFPAAPEGATGAAIEYSVAGMIGHTLAHVFAPIGFNWQISIALVPGMAAREVAVSSLSTVYALSAVGEDAAAALAPVIANTWSLATAFSLLAWFVFAPQCLSTLATVKRETNGWKMPLIMAGYLFVLAYLASFVTYRISLMLGLG